MLTEWILYFCVTEGNACIRQKQTFQVEQQCLAVQQQWEHSPYFRAECRPISIPDPAQ